MSANRSKQLRILLAISLALNLFVGGAIAASSIIGDGWLAGLIGHDHHRASLTGMPNPRQLRAVLDDEDQAALEATLQARRALFRDSLAAMLAAREAAAAAVAAEPFDRTRVEAAFATLREREAAIASAAQGTILDLVSQLDADGRRKVSELLKPRYKPRDAQGQ
jgi:uncharacterized membrane protein